MAGSQIEIEALAFQTQRLGYQAISLTHFGDNVEPEIAAGSVVEVGGALFEFGADEAIGGLGAIAAGSDVWIKLTVAGTAITATGVTAPAPTWDTAKQGWYSGAERYIGGLYKDAGGDYVRKYLFEFMGISSIKLFGDGTVGIWDGLGFLAKKVLEIGDWDMDAYDSSSVALALGVAVNKVRMASALIINDAGTRTYPIDGFYSVPAEQPYGGIYYLNPTVISLWRKVGGFFDNADFDATPYNRGWVMIEYEV